MFLLVCSVLIFFWFLCFFYASVKQIGRSVLWVRVIALHQYGFSLLVVSLEYFRSYFIRVFVSYMCFDFDVCGVYVLYVAYFGVVSSCGISRV